MSDSDICKTVGCSGDAEYGGYCWDCEYDEADGFEVPPGCLPTLIVIALCFLAIIIAFAGVILWAVYSFCFA